MDTPVLIPNTEVKHISGDNIWTGSSEDSTLPGNLTHLTMGLFFVWNFFVAISVRYQECIAYRRCKIHRFKESCIVKSQGSSIEKILGTFN